MERRETPTEARARAAQQIAAYNALALGMVETTIAAGLASSQALRELEAAFAGAPQKLRDQAARVIDGCRTQPHRAADYLRMAGHGLDVHLALAGEGDEEALEAMLRDGISAVDLRMAVNAYAVAEGVFARAERRAPSRPAPPTDRRYRGVRSLGYVVVTVEPGGEMLDPRLDLANHSPDGFEWGYPGSGPAQLALAMCADALADDARALRVYRAFKARVIANLPRKVSWLLSAPDVVRCIELMEARGGL
jgi:hypothetical protein